MFSFIESCMSAQTFYLLKWNVLMIVNTITITEVVRNTWNIMVKVSYVMLYVMAESATGKY